MEIDRTEPEAEPAKVPMLDEGWTVAAGYSHAATLLALLALQDAKGKD